MRLVPFTAVLVDAFWHTFVSDALISSGATESWTLAGIGAWSVREYAILLGPLIGAWLWAWYALSVARLIVQQRRCVYKKLWHRTAFSPAEEAAVVLLGRIKGYRRNFRVLGAVVLFTAVWLVWKKDIRTPAQWRSVILFLAFVGAAMALHLYLHALNTAKAIPEDRKAPLNYGLPESRSGRYVVQIDLRQVQNFIVPRNALPFWSLFSVRLTLMSFGFRPLTHLDTTEDAAQAHCHFLTTRELLHHLDEHEILEIRDASGRDVEATL